MIKSILEFILAFVIMILIYLFYETMIMYNDKNKDSE